MTNFVIDQEYIKPLIEQGKVNILAQNECSKFDEYISTKFPWLEFTDRIDWSKRKIKELSLKGASFDQIENFIANSNLGSFKYLGIVFSAFEPGVYGKSHTIIENLFSFIAHSSGPFFIIAIEIDEIELPILCKTRFIEGNRIKRTLIAFNE